MSTVTGRLAYLASPYTHTDKAIEMQRYEAALNAWKWLLANDQNIHFFVPIVQSHQLCVRGGLPGDWKFWADFDGTMLSRCQELWVLAIPGFQQSTGVNAEIKIATELGLPIKYLVPQGDTYEVSTSPPAGI